jgi:hypothetical protein
MAYELSNKQNFVKALLDYNGQEINGVDVKIHYRLYGAAGDVLNCSDELPPDYSRIIDWLFQRNVPYTYGGAAKLIREEMDLGNALNAMWKQNQAAS